MVRRADRTHLQPAAITPQRRVLTNAKEKTMVKKSRIALIATVVALGFASPAMAQSTYRNFGTGNEMSPHFQPRAAAEQPAWTKSDSADTSALTGGGDAGYNEMNSIDGSEETGS